MYHPVAELTRVGEENAVFAEVRPSYTPRSETSIDITEQYQPQARTTIYAREADESHHYDQRGESAESYYTRLWRYHQRWDDDRSGRRTLKDKIVITQALASSLPVSAYERREAVMFVQAHSGRRFNQYGGLPGMALGAFAAIRDEVLSGRASQLDDPFERRLISCDRFTEICEKHDVDGSSAHKKAKRMRRDE
jgi:hypothetical protein